MITTVEQFALAAPLTRGVAKAIKDNFNTLDELEEWLSDEGRRNIPGIARNGVSALTNAWESLVDQMAAPDFDEAYGATLPEQPGDITGELMRAENPVRKAGELLLANSQGPRRNVNWNELATFFDPADIEWKPLTMPKKGMAGTSLFVPYVTARAVQQRLDLVCGPDGWQNIFSEGPQGGVMCGIGILTPEGWIWKYDGADNTAVEAIKGGFSGAFRRAAVHWGIGRYLYFAPRQWIEVNAKHKPLSQPTLPSSMLPGAAGKSIRWANADELEPAGPGMDETRATMASNFDNSPAATSAVQRSAQKQRANQPQSRKPQRVGDALPKNIPQIQVPLPNANAVEGDYPKFQPGPENWNWAMPESTKRKENGKVTNNDLQRFQKHYKDWGWGTDGVMEMLNDVFDVPRFSLLTYAEFCGIWILVTYAEAFNEYMGRAAYHRAQREQDREPA